MNRDWYIIKEGRVQIGVGFPDNLNEDVIEVRPMDSGSGVWIYLTVAEVNALHALVEAEVTRRAAIAEQERIETQAQGRETQEAIDRMEDNDPLKTRMEQEGIKRGWVDSASWMRMGG